MPQLNPVWFASQLFWLVVSMAVLYVLMSRLALPRLMGVMELRRITREDDLSEAASMEKEAESAREEYERALQDAHLRAAAMFAEAEQSSRQAAEKALADLHTSLHDRTKAAEKHIGKTRQDLVRALKPALASLTSLAVQKLSGHAVDDKRVQSVLESLSDEDDEGDRDAA